jgi:hypothetical protein
MFVEKVLCNQEISVPSASTHVSWEISRTNKDSLLPEDVHPLPKPEPICKRRQKNVKSCILTDSLIKDCIKQEALTRAAIKKKYCKWAKIVEIKNSSGMLQKINFFFK